MRVPPLVALLLTASILVAAIPSITHAETEKQLRRVRGTIGYQESAAAPFSAVFGHVDLPDDAFAITQGKSAAELALPDSSIVALGENTRVRVGAFANAASGPGSTVAVDGGALRFDIRRPAGGHADYHFVTTTSQIAVRGTVGLLSFVSGTTTVACVECAADSVTVTVGPRTYALANGDVVIIDPAGQVKFLKAGPETLQSFSLAGLNTLATLPEFIGGDGTAPVAGAAGAGVSGVAIAGAVAVAAGIAIAASGHSTTSTPNLASPSPSPSPTASPTHTPTALPTPAPTASPTPAPTASPTPAPTASPTPAPTASPTATPTHAPTPTPSPSPNGTIIVNGRARAPGAGVAPPTAMPAPVAVPPAPFGGHR